MIFSGILEPCFNLKKKIKNLALKESKNCVVLCIVFVYGLESLTEEDSIVSSNG